jgi:hypothetical protein
MLKNAKALKCVAPADKGIVEIKGFGTEAVKTVEAAVKEV